MGLFGNNETVTTTFAAKDQMTPVVRGIRSTMDQFKRDAATGFGLAGGISVFNLAAQGIGMVTDLLGDAGEAASAMNETQSKLGAVFRTTADDIRDWAKDSATAMGLSQQAALEATGTFGNFLMAMGQSEGAASDMSRAMVQLAADLGSFNNQDPTEVLDALRSGLSGETEPLRRFGVDISDAAVSAELLASGLKKVKGQFTQAQKIQGRYALIMRQTATAQGDFARTATGTANAAKVLSAQIEDTKVRAGEFVNNATNAAIVLGTQLLAAINDVTDSFTPYNAAVQKGIDYINDYGKATEEAVKPTRELADQIEADAVKAYADAWRDYLDVNMDLINQQDMTGRTLQTLRDMNLDFARATGQSVDALTVLALRVVAAGGDIDDLVIAMQGLIAQGIDLKSMAMRYVHDTGEMVGSTTKFKLAVRSIPTVTTHAVTDMKQAIKEGKASIIEEFRDLAWQSKHPFATTNYEKWLEKRQQDAIRKMKQAAKEGRPDVVEQYRQLIQDIRDEISGLPGYAARIGETAMAQLANIGASVTALMGYGEDGHATPTGGGGGGRHGRKGGKGGRSNKRGVVHQRGSGSRQMGGGSTAIYVDGRRLFEIIDARNGRAIAMGG